MEAKTVSETSYTNSILLWLIAREVSTESSNKHLQSQFSKDSDPNLSEQALNSLHTAEIFTRFHLPLKIVPVTGREGPEGCETSRLPHVLDNRLIDGGEVVSLTHRFLVFISVRG
jgi:hypothetical protein